MTKELSYKDTLKKSRFCICPGGHEVASPRIVEVTYAECVPGLISQHHVLPFSDVLNWESFSVQVPVSEIPSLKNILMGVENSAPNPTFVEHMDMATNFLTTIA